MIFSWWKLPCFEIKLQSEIDKRNYQQENKGNYHAKQLYRKRAKLAKDNRESKSETTKSTIC